MNRPGTRHLDLRLPPVPVSEPAALHIGKTQIDKTEARTACLCTQEPFIVHRLPEIETVQPESLIAGTAHEYGWMTDSHTPFEKARIARDQIGPAVVLPILKLAICDVGTTLGKRMHGCADCTRLVPVVAVKNAHDIPK